MYWLALALTLTVVVASPRSTAAQGGDAGITEEPPIETGAVPGEDELTGASYEQVAEVARELNCPLCQGYNLQDCPLTVCAQMRGLIGQRLAEGASADVIKAEFVAQYGPQVLNEPPRAGWDLLAWLLPVAVVLASAAVAARAIGRAAGDASPSPERTSESTAGAAVGRGEVQEGTIADEARRAYEERVDKLLAERDE